MRGSFSGSVEPDASKLQASPLHDEVNAAVGAWLVGAGTTPGLMTTENRTERPTDSLVVAVRPVAVPVGTAPAESARMALTLPAPVPVVLVRATVVSGTVQVGVTEDFSLQTFTSHELASATGADGVVWLVAAVSTAVLADADTVGVSPELRYAATLRTDLARASVVTVTLLPASDSVAVRVQARPRVPFPSRDSNRRQPVTAFWTVLVVEFVVRNRTRVSPACTLFGIRTVWLVRFPAVLAASTKATSPCGAVGLTSWVALSVEVPSLRVRVTVCVPPVL